MKKAPYSGSFLLCFHGDALDAYISGVPLASIRGNEVTPHFLKDADGNPRSIELGQITNCPFTSRDELRERLVEIVTMLSDSGLPNDKDQGRPQNTYTLSPP